MCPMPNEVCQVQNFPEYQIIFPNIAQDFLIFAKVAKFRQIWSHWVYQPKCQIILPNIAKDFLIFAKVAKFCQICSLWFEFTTYLSTVSSHNPWSASVCLIPSAHNIQFCCNIQLLFCHFALLFFFTHPKIWSHWVYQPKRGWLWLNLKFSSGLEFFSSFFRSEKVFQLSVKCFFSFSWVQ